MTAIVIFQVIVSGSDQYVCNLFEELGEAI